MSPSDVFTQRHRHRRRADGHVQPAAFFTNLGTSLAMIFTGIITALAFIAITVQFVVAMVESYIIVAAGFIFVGFGGSRWTAPYVERYIGLGVATGVKIMLLYLLIGTGMNLSVDWMTDAQNIAANSSPAMSALEIMGASIIFMMLCWQIPKLFAAVLGGSPALSGGDLVSSGAFVAGGAVAVGSLAALAPSAAGAAVCCLAGGGGGCAAVLRRRTCLAQRCSRRLAPAAAEVEPYRRRRVRRAHRPNRRSLAACPHRMSDAARNLTGIHRRIASQVPTGLRAARNAAAAEHRSPRIKEFTVTSAVRLEDPIRSQTKDPHRKQPGRRTTHTSPHAANGTNDTGISSRANAIGGSWRSSALSSLCVAVGGMIRLVDEVAHRSVRRRHGFPRPNRGGRPGGRNLAFR